MAELSKRRQVEVLLASYRPDSLGSELCLTWLAVQDAPVGHVVGQSGPDGFFPEHSGAIVQMDDPASVKGKRVRLVRDGDSGEGES